MDDVLGWCRGRKKMAEIPVDYRGERVEIVVPGMGRCVEFDIATR